MCIYCMKGEAIQRQLTWCAGLSRLSCSSDQPDLIDKRNEKDQLSATPHIMGEGAAWW